MSKAISVFVAITFMVTSIAWNPSGAAAAVVAFEFPGRISSQSELAVAVHDIPEELGSITRMWEPPVKDVSSKPFLIQIQDAHSNPGGEANIAGILQYLEEKFPGMIVGLEGAAGPLRPDYLDFFPSYSEANEAVVRDLHQKGELNGVELYLWKGYQQRPGVAATRPQAQSIEGSVSASDLQPPVSGVEDPALYRENLRTYRDLLSQRGEVQALLNPIHAELDKRSSKILSPELRDFLKERSRRKEGKFSITQTAANPDLQVYVRFLRAQALKILKIDLTDEVEQLRFPNLVRVLLAEEEQKGLDTVAAQVQWQRILESLNQAAVEKNEKEFVAALSTYAMTQKLIPDAAGRHFSYPVERSLYPRKLLEGLMLFVQKHPLRISEHTQFLKAWRLLVFQAEIDVTELMQEMKMLESGILSKLTRTEAEKKLIAETEDLALLEKLLNLEVSRPEYERALTRRTDLETMAGTSKLPFFLEKAYGFYEVSVQRDQALLNNLLRAIPASRDGKAPVAVLMSGGFHTGGVETILQGLGIGYAVVTPRIRSIDGGGRYQKVMSGENADLSAYFEVKNPFATKQEAIFFKQLLETAAPVLFDRYKEDPAAIASHIQKAIESHPLLSKSMTVRTQERGKQLRIMTQPGTVTPENTAIIDASLMAPDYLGVSSSPTPVGVTITLGSAEALTMRAAAPSRPLKKTAVAEAGNVLARSGKSFKRSELRPFDDRREEVAERILSVIAFDRSVENGADDLLWGVQQAVPDKETAKELIQSIPKDLGRIATLIRDRGIQQDKLQERAFEFLYQFVEAGASDQYIRRWMEVFGNHEMMLTPDGVKEHMLQRVNEKAVLIGNLSIFERNVSKMQQVGLLDELSVQALLSAVQALHQKLMSETQLIEVPDDEGPSSRDPSVRSEMRTVIVPWRGEGIVQRDDRATFQSQVDQALKEMPQGHGEAATPNPQALAAKLEKLDLAIANSKQEIADIIDLNRQSQVGGIFEGHSIIVEDSTFRQSVAAQLSKGADLAQAVLMVSRENRDKFLQIPDDYLKLRAADICDSGLRILRNLHTQQEPEPSFRGKIVITEELYPSDLLERYQEAAAILVFGDVGEKSHAAMIAKALKIPLMTISADTAKEFKNGDAIQVDGEGEQRRVALKSEEKSILLTTPADAQGLLSKIKSFSGSALILKARYADEYLTPSSMKEFWAVIDQLRSAFAGAGMTVSGELPAEIKDERAEILDQIVSDIRQNEQAIGVSRKNPVRVFLETLRRQIYEEIEKNPGQETAGEEKNARAEILETFRAVLQARYKLRMSPEEQFENLRNALVKRINRQERVLQNLQTGEKIQEKLPATQTSDAEKREAEAHGIAALMSATVALQNLKHWKGRYFGVDGTEEQKTIQAATMKRLQKKSVLSVLHEDLLTSKKTKDLLEGGFYQWRRFLQHLKATNEPAWDMHYYKGAVPDLIGIVEDIMAEITEQDPVDFSEERGQGEVVVVVPEAMGTEQYKSIERHFGSRLRGVVVSKQKGNATPQTHWIAIAQVPVFIAEKDAVIEKIKNGNSIFVQKSEGQIGRFFIDPSDAFQKAAKEEEDNERKVHKAIRRLSGVSKIIDFLANVTGLLAAVVKEFASGIGLTRTEIDEEAVKLIIRMIRLNRDTQQPFEGLNQGLLGLLLEKYEVQIRNAYLKKKVNTFRTFDFQPDKDEDLFVHLGDIKPGFEFYRSPLGQTVLQTQLAAFLVLQAEGLLRGEELSRLQVMFPQVRDLQDVRFVFEENMPQALALATKTLQSRRNSLNAETTAELISKAYETIRFGIMDETGEISQGDNLKAVLTYQLNGRPVIDFVSVGMNDKEIAITEIVNALPPGTLNRDIGALSVFLGKLSPSFIKYYEKTAQVIQEVNQSSGRNITLCFCGETAGRSKFVLFALYLKYRYGISVSASMDPSKIADDRFLLDQIIAQGSLAEGSRKAFLAHLELMVHGENPDEALEKYAAGLTENKKKILLAIENWQVRYEQTGFYGSFNHLDLNVVEGVGSAWEFDILKGILKAYAPDLPLSDQKRVTGREFLSIEEYLLEHHLIFKSEEKLLSDAVDFMFPVRSEFEEKSKTDPRYRETLTPEILGEFAQSLGYDPDQFSRLYDAHARHIFEITSRIRDDILESMFPSEYPEDEKKILKTYAGPDGGEDGAIVLKLRKGMSFLTERGHAYDEHFVVEYEGKDPDALSKNPKIMQDIFMLGAQHEARIGRETQRFLKKYVAEVKSGGAKRIGIKEGWPWFLDFLRLRKPLSYMLKRMNRFPFMESAPDYFPGDGQPFTASFQALRAFEEMDHFAGTNDLAFKRVGGVFKKILQNPDSDRLLVLRLSLDLRKEILRGVTRTDLADLGQLWEKIALETRSVLKTRMDGDPRVEEWSRQIAWLIYHQQLLSQHDFINEEELINALHLVLRSPGFKDWTGQRDTRFLFDLLYVMSFALRMTFVESEKVSIAIRAGENSPWANLDKFFLAGKAVLMGQALLDDDVSFKEQLKALVDLADEAVRNDSVIRDPKSTAPSESVTAAGLREKLLKGMGAEFTSSAKEYFRENQRDPGDLIEILRILEDPEAVSSLVDRFMKFQSVYYLSVLKEDELMEQLIFFADLERLVASKRFNLVPSVFTPLYHPYHHAYEVLLGVPLSSQGILEVYLRVLQQAGFHRESIKVKLSEIPGRKEKFGVIRLTGYFPHHIQNPSGSILEIQEGFKAILGNLSLASRFKEAFRGRAKKILDALDAAYGDFELPPIPSTWRSSALSGGQVHFEGTKDLIVRTADRPGFDIAILEMIRKYNLNLDNFILDIAQTRFPRILIRFSEPVGEEMRKNILKDISDLMKTFSKPIAIHQGVPETLPGSSESPASPAQEASPEPSGEAAAGASDLVRIPWVREEDGSWTLKAQITNEFSIHARPAALMVKTALSFPNLALEFSNETQGSGFVSANDIMSILELGNARADHVVFRVRPAAGTTLADPAGELDELRETLARLKDENSTKKKESIFAARSELRAARSLAIAMAGALVSFGTWFYPSESFASNASSAVAAPALASGANIASSVFAQQRILQLVQQGKDIPRLKRAALAKEAQKSGTTVAARIQKNSESLWRLIDDKNEGLYRDLPRLEKMAMHNRALFILGIESRFGFYKMQRGRDGRLLAIGIGNGQNEVQTLANAVRRAQERTGRISALNAGIREREAEYLARALGLSRPDLNVLIAEAGKEGPSHLGYVIAQHVVPNDDLDLFFVLRYINEVRERLEAKGSKLSSTKKIDFWQKYYYTRALNPARQKLANKVDATLASHYINPQNPGIAGRVAVSPATDMIQASSVEGPEPLVDLPLAAGGEPASTDLEDLGAELASEFGDEGDGILSVAAGIGHGFHLVMSNPDERSKFFGLLGTLAFLGVVPIGNRLIEESFSTKNKKKRSRSSRRSEIRKTTHVDGAEGKAFWVYSPQLVFQIGDTEYRVEKSGGILEVQRFLNGEAAGGLHQVSSKELMFGNGLNFGLGTFNTKDPKTARLHVYVKVEHDELKGDYFELEDRSYQGATATGVKPGIDVKTLPTETVEFRDIPAEPKTPQKGGNGSMDDTGEGDRTRFFDMAALQEAAQKPETQKAPVLSLAEQLQREGVSKEALLLVIFIGKKFFNFPDEDAVRPLLNALQPLVVEKRFLQAFIESFDHQGEKNRPMLEQYFKELFRLLEDANRLDIREKIFPASDFSPVRELVSPSTIGILREFARAETRSPEAGKPNELDTRKDEEINRLNDELQTHFSSFEGIEGENPFKAVAERRKARDAELDPQSRLLQDFVDVLIREGMQDLLLKDPDLFLLRHYPGPSKDDEGQDLLLAWLNNRMTQVRTWVQLYPERAVTDPDFPAFTRQTEQELENLNKVLEMVVRYKKDPLFAEWARSKFDHLLLVAEQPATYKLVHDLNNKSTVFGYVQLYQDEIKEEDFSALMGYLQRAKDLKWLRTPNSIRERDASLRLLEEELERAAEIIDRYSSIEDFASVRKSLTEFMGLISEFKSSGAPAFSSFLDHNTSLLVSLANLLQDTNRLNRESGTLGKPTTKDSIMALHDLLRRLFASKKMEALGLIDPVYAPICRLLGNNFEQKFLSGEFKVRTYPWDVEGRSEWFIHLMAQGQFAAIYSLSAIQEPREFEVYFRLTREFNHWSRYAVNHPREAVSKKEAAVPYEQTLYQTADLSRVSSALIKLKKQLFDPQQAQLQAKFYGQRILGHLYFLEQNGMWQNGRLTAPDLENPEKFLEQLDKIRSFYEQLYGTLLTDLRRSASSDPTLDVIFDTVTKGGELSAYDLQSRLTVIGAVISFLSTAAADIQREWPSLERELQKVEGIARYLETLPLYSREDLKIVDSHNLSALGYVFLPVPQRDSRAAPIEDQIRVEDEIDLVPDRSEGGAVLLIEDDPEVLRITHRMLRSFGMSVFAVSGGEEAKEVLQKEKVGLIITDINLGKGLSGDQLVESWDQEGLTGGMPVILMSGDDIGSAGRTMRPNAVFIEKPLNQERLRDQIRSMIRSELRVPRSVIVIVQTSLRYVPADHPAYELLSGAQSALSGEKPDIEQAIRLLDEALEKIGSQPIQHQETILTSLGSSIQKLKNPPPAESKIKQPTPAVISGQRALKFSQDWRNQVIGSAIDRIAKTQGQEVAWELVRRINEHLESLARQDVARIRLEGAQLLQSQQYARFLSQGNRDYVQKTLGRLANQERFIPGEGERRYALNSAQADIIRDILGETYAREILNFPPLRSELREPENPETLVGTLEYKKGLVGKNVPTAELPVRREVREAIIQTAGHMGIYFDKGVAAEFKEGITEENVQKARRWIEAELVRRAQGKLHGREMADPDLKKALEKVANAVPGSVAIASSSLERGPAVHVDLRFLKADQWSQFFKVFRIISATRSTLNEKLVFDVNKTEIGLVQSLYAEFLRMQGLEIEKDEIRFNAVTGNDLKVGRVNAVLAPEERVKTVTFRKNGPQHWAMDQGADSNLSLLAANIVTVLWAVRDEAVTQRYLDIHTPKEYSHTLLNAVLASIAALQSIKQAA